MTNSGTAGHERAIAAKLIPECKKESSSFQRNSGESHPHFRLLGDVETLVLDFLPSWPIELSLDAWVAGSGEGCPEGHLGNGDSPVVVNLRNGRPSSAWLRNREHDRPIQAGKQSPEQIRQLGDVDLDSIVVSMRCFL
jgi:hypothetical protein